MGQLPQVIQIYHIVHVDRLPSILDSNMLFCDSEGTSRQLSGTVIGLNKIKQRRIDLHLSSYPDLCVGSCVPFYFCPRSVMLYLIYKQNSELDYQGGQKHVIHLVADLFETVSWANENNRRWAFTTSNAGSRYFTDFNDLQKLNAINWDAVNSRAWNNCKEEKQAEFLLEQDFPWFLVKEIGVFSKSLENKVALTMTNSSHVPIIKVTPDWYY